MPASLCSGPDIDSPSSADIATGKPIRFSRALRHWAFAVVLLSVAWRTTRWLLQFPVWGDEAYLCINFLDRDYIGMTQPLRAVQVAPLLFLWGELAVYQALGGAEWAMRLLPFLAGLGTLVLFWRLARMALPALPRYLAITLFAASYYPVRHSCEIKPYSLDLLMALALVLLALTWLRQPWRLRWLLLLAALVPVALCASYPAVFVAGAVGLVLLPAVWRQRRWETWAVYVLYNVLMIAGFAGPYLLAGRGQFASTGGTQNTYWAEWFPPEKPAPLAWWLVKAHTGNMLAYPIGGPNCASALTTLLCLIGAWRLGRSRRSRLLMLLVVPFGLTLLAAALHRYPYGGSARIAQHLAPAICLLAGAGLGVVLGWWRPTSRRRASYAICAALAVGPVGGIVWDMYKPYKTEGDREVRRIVAEVFAQAGPADQIVVLNEFQQIGATFEWYLRQHDGRFTWGGALDSQRLARGGDVWVLSFGKESQLPAVFAPRLAALPRRLTPVRHDAHELQLGRIGFEGTMEHCQVFRWTDADGQSVR
jgi:hypothetical protein